MKWIMYRQWYRRQNGRHKWRGFQQQTKSSTTEVSFARRDRSDRLVRKTAANAVRQPRWFWAHDMKETGRLAAACVPIWVNCIAFSILYTAWFPPSCPLHLVRFHIAHCLCFDNVWHFWWCVVDGGRRSKVIWQYGSGYRHMHKFILWRRSRKKISKSKTNRT